MELYFHIIGEFSGSDVLRETPLEIARPPHVRPSIVRGRFDDVDAAKLLPVMM